MRFVFAAFVMMAMLAGPAYSQKGGATGDVNPANRDPYQMMLEREKAEREDNERAYNAQMKRLKSQAATPTNSDPWKGVRQSSDPAPKR